MPTPLGNLALAAAPTGLVACSFGGAEQLSRRLGAGPRTPETGRILDQAVEEIGAYLAGELQEFRVPVDLRVPEFDRRVLAALTREVGYGTTTSYGALARGLGLPVTAARAVGRALGSNPVLLVVPCHRVVGSTGALTGYAGGLPVKQALLDLESVHCGDTGDLRLF